MRVFSGVKQRGVKTVALSKIARQTKENSAETRKKGNAKLERKIAASSTASTSAAGKNPNK